MNDNLEHFTAIKHKTANSFDIKDKLQSILDLSENEISVYFVLLTNDKLTANNLSLITQIQRTRIYDIVRRLIERDLIELISDNPQRYSAVSPRIAIDNFLFKRRQNIEVESSKLTSLLPTLQKIWNDQHEEILSNRVSLVSEEFIQEIIPQEMKIAQNKLCLGLRDFSEDSPLRHTKLFDPREFSIGIQDFLQRGVLLHILLGDDELFLEKAHPFMLKTLLNGLLEGTIEVRAVKSEFPQSFLIVDDERVFLFFLNDRSDAYSEAMRASNRSMRDFFQMIWKKFWVEASPLNIEAVVKAIDIKSTSGMHSIHRLKKQEKNGD
ncbi:MAG: TrmB family transcriptional regulator [Candidatus Hodarchaeales archaeon]|jgi:DNA-binding MarR family transcriptional regulator